MVEPVTKRGPGSGAARSTGRASDTRGLVLADDVPRLGAQAARACLRGDERLRLQAGPVQQIGAAHEAFGLLHDEAGDVAAGHIGGGFGGPPRPPARALGGGPAPRGGRVARVPPFVSGGGASWAYRGGGGG